MPRATTLRKQQPNSAALSYPQTKVLLESSELNHDKYPPVPDHIQPHLDILFCGINPGLISSIRGHHYAHPGNRFWPTASNAGLFHGDILTAEQDYLLPMNYNLGLTNIVARPSKAQTDLSKDEIKQGGQVLGEKVQRFKPKVLCFVGKGIYEVYTGKKCPSLGWQPNDAILWTCKESRSYSKKEKEDVKVDHFCGKTEVFVVRSTSGLACRWNEDNLELFKQLQKFTGDIVASNAKYRILNAT